MNCCDYNCDQGRDCPARKPTANLVARVGRSYPAHQPEAEMPEATGWQILKWLAISALIVAAMAWMSLLLVLIGQRIGQLL